MACLLWLLVVAGGIAVTLNYENAAGRTGNTPRQWPAGASIALDSDRDTLLLFVHPQCPCTRATVEELNRLLVANHDRVQVHVFCYHPANTPDQWTQTELWRSVAAIPGVALHEDPAGRVSQQFGAETSGYVVLYNPRGQLLFKGGITAGRGHIGDNVGESTVASLLSGESVAVKQTPVYGCSMLACPQPGVIQ